MEKDVRIVHMLAHTSGLGETEMAWRPEERRFRYSDKAYDILGRVISETEGRSFEDFMRTESSILLIWKTHPSPYI